MPPRSSQPGASIALLVVVVIGLSVALGGLAAIDAYGLRGFGLLVGAAGIGLGCALLFKALVRAVATALGRLRNGVLALGRRLSNDGSSAGLPRSGQLAAFVVALGVLSLLLVVATSGADLLSARAPAANFGVAADSAGGGPAGGVAVLAQYAVTGATVLGGAVVTVLAVASLYKALVVAVAYALATVRRATRLLH